MFGASHGRCGSVFWSLSGAEVHQPSDSRCAEHFYRKIPHFGCAQWPGFRGGACSDWCYMLVLCAVCRVVARRDSTLYPIAVIVPVWNGFSHGYEYENEWLCMLYGRMIIRPYTLWHLYEFYVILLNNTTKILWNMPQEIIFATFVVASAAIIQRLRQTLHNEKAS